jgi:hypothetical protein
MILNIFTSKYRIVAYNNRMYKNYRFVDNKLYNFIDAKLWIENNGDRSRYLYDLYDIKKNELFYNYENMIDEYYTVKNIINSKNNNGHHVEALKKFIFNFKDKWQTKHTKKAPQMYFEDLMTIFNEKINIY